MGDEKRLIGIFVAAQKWDEAFAMCNRFNGHHEEIYRPYAEWLVENDRFEEAQVPSLARNAADVSCVTCSGTHEMHTACVHVVHAQHTFWLFTS